MRKGAVTVATAENSASNKPSLCCNTTNFGILKL